MRKVDTTIISARLIKQRSYSPANKPIKGEERDHHRGCAQAPE
jgi:hypothetical protein